MVVICFCLWEVVYVKVVCVLERLGVDWDVVYIYVDVIFMKVSKNFGVVVNEDWVEVKC